MNNKSLIYKSITMIESNLKSDLSMNEIASSVGFSYYYYSRLFKAITGISPSTYMNQRKIADSVEMLMTTDKKIIDVALMYGYGSPEAYTRAFTRIFDQAPTDVRKQGLIYGERMLNPLEEGETFGEESQPFRKPEIVELEGIHLVGLSFYYDFATNKNDLTEQYNYLVSCVSKLEGVKQPIKMYQMQYWFDNQKSDSVYFFIAVEAEKNCQLPIQLISKTIPAGKYLKFYHKGLANQVSKTYDYIYREWLPRTEYQLPFNYNFEYYGKESLGPYHPDSISEIYIPVREKG
jgi:AraC family transcriptional regulator